MSQMTCEQLYNIWRSEPQLIRILDLRPVQEYQKAHIPGAISLSPDELESAMVRLDGRLAVLIAPEFMKESLLPGLRQHENYMFLRDCHDWGMMDLPLAGQALRRMMEHAPDPTRALISRTFHDLPLRALSYILADAASGEAVLVDPIPTQRQAYENAIRELKLRLMFVLQTHQHAAEWKWQRQLAEELGAQFACSHAAVGPLFDLRLEDGQELLLGEHSLLVMETPGHTPCSVCYSIAGRVLTGDALALQGWGGSAEYPGATEDLESSIQKKLYQLPDETLVLPAHAAGERLSSTIGLEKKTNAFLPWQRTRDEFMSMFRAD